MIYSYSSITSFENCPHKFKLAYIDKIKPLRRNIEAFMGSRVHEALEKLYRDKIYEKICSLEELLSFYNRRWEKEMSSQIFVVKEYDVENYRKMGERYLIDYYNTYKPFDEGRTIALEKRVFFPLNEKYWITGIIDRITEVDGIYEVHDYKTSLYLPTKKDIENDCQLQLYALALNYLYGAEEVELVWHFLAFNKEMRIKKESYEEAKNEVIKKIEKIEEACKINEFPATESNICPYCEYQQICPLFRHHYKIEELEAEEAKEEEGFSLVNKYWEISRKITELKALQEEIREKIIEYAKKNEMQYVYGSEKIANVKIYRNVYFKEMEKVEEILREEGLYEKYSKVDAISLSKALLNDEMPTHIKNKLQELAEEREVIKIYLRNIEREE